MRILFAHDHLCWPELCAGRDANTHWLILELIGRGHRIALSARQRQAGARPDLGYEVFLDGDEVAAARRALAAVAPDVVVLQAAGHAGLAALLTDEQARLLYVHSVTTEPHGLSIEARERAVWVSCSTSVAQHLRLGYGIGSVVVPPLFGVERFAGLACEPRHVLMGSIQHRKGTDIAIRLAERRPDVPFVFVDSWNENAAQNAALKQAIARLPNARLLANAPDITSVIAGSRLVLMPSRSREAWGRTATECQSLGVPVLASSRGNLPSTVGPGGTTLDPDQPFEQWAAAFDWIWDDAAHYRALAGMARDHAGQLLKSKHAIADRFETCLYAAVPAQRPASGGSVVGRRAPDRPALLTRQDLRLLRGLPVHALAALLSSVEELHAYARRNVDPDPSRLAAAAERIARGLGVDDAHDIACEGRAARDEVVLQCLRSRLRGWTPELALEGRAHLDRALAVGRGAVLWIEHFVFASNVAKMALHRAGYRAAQVSRPQHGLSDSRFGRAVLNRLRSGFENRFLDRRLVLRRDDPGQAMRAARSILGAGGLVMVTAGAWEGNRLVDVAVPGGIRRLSTGPARLAELTGAALLPVHALRVGVDSYRVTVGGPIDLAQGAVAAVVSFANRAIAPALRHPEQWRAWGSLL